MELCSEGDLAEANPRDRGSRTLILVQSRKRVTVLTILGDLHEMLRRNNGAAFSERECLFMTGQLVEGLHALHERGIVHGDASPKTPHTSPGH